MSTNRAIEAEYLYCDTGNHDKVYNLGIQAIGDGYQVIAEYGARGGVLKRIVKYSGPSLPSARIEYGKLRREKVNKGYRPMVHDLSGKSTLNNVPVTNQFTSKPAKPNKLKLPTAEIEEVPERRLDIDL